jgi:glycosyltransferase involved in cell wall biosynthesis
MFLAYIRIFKKFKFIVFVHDIFPENLLVSHIISRRSLLYKISTKIFNYAYRKADLLITCGRDMQKTIIQKIKNKNKVLFIPNFCDNDLLYPVNKKENIIIQNLNLYDKLVVFFTGNIGRMQNIDYLIETAELLKDDDLISFLFIGNGVYQNKVENYSKKNKNVFFVPAMERRDAIVFLNAGDVGISTLLPHMMGVGVPSKTYSYMATGKPIIAVMDTDSEIAMMVQEEENGWVVEASNPKQLASLLKQLKEVPGIIKEKGRKSFELSRTKYSVENITVQYVDAILNL